MRTSSSENASSSSPSGWGAPVFLCLLVLLIIGIILYHRSSLTRAREMAKNINRQGLQRMRLERIGRLAEMLMLARSDKEKEAVRSRFQATLNALTKEAQRRGGLSELQELLTQGRQLLSIPNQQLSDQQADVIKIRSFLKDDKRLDSIHQSVVRQQEQTIQELLNFERLSLWLLIGLGLASAFALAFIVLSALRSSRQSFQNLEGLVQARTIELQEQNRALLDTTQRLSEHHRLFMSTVDLLCIAGFDGRFKLINPAFQRVLGYPLDQIWHTPFLELVHPEDRTITVRELAKLQEGVTSLSFENRYVCRSGEVVWLSWTAVPFPDEGLIFATAHNTTQRKQYEMELEQVNQTLQQRNEELDQFAYVASHDLQSPLRGIDKLCRWLTEDLSLDQLPETSRKHLRQMRQRVDRLHNLLDDLLLYSRAGQSSSTTEVVNCDKLIQEVVDLLEIPVAFDVSIPESLPTFKTYRPPLTQIFQNLIQNAIKHHDREQGEIIVRAHCKGKQVEFSVADDGPGIPFEYQERVFKMFQTLRRRDEVEGSGMGLAIVKKIIEAHEGEISLDSEPGKGTTVRFTWPRQLQSTGNSRPVVDR